MNVIIKDGRKMKELTVRATNADPHVLLVKCPMGSKDVYMVETSICRKCNYFAGDGYREKKGQHFIVCSFQK